MDRTVCEKGMLVTPYRPHIQADKRWRFRGERGNMYADTHVAFYRFLRSGTWKQTLESAANKTLVAIMGREAAQHFATYQEEISELYKKRNSDIF